MGIGIFISQSKPEELMLFNTKYLNFPTSSAAEFTAIALALTIVPSKSLSVIKSDNSDSISVIKKYTSTSYCNT